MSRNPYAPPNASVADPSGPSVPRPLVVRRAVQLLCIAYACSVATLFLRDDGISGPPVWIFMTLYAGLMAWLILKIARRRNWARIVYLCLALLSYLDTVSGWKFYLASYHGHITGIALDLGSSVLEIIALCLLFTKPANAWFKLAMEP